MILDRILTAGVLVILFYLLFFIGKRVNDFLHREYNLVEELVQKDNPALAIAITGYYLGLVIALGGTLVGPTRGIIDDALDLCIYGMLSIVLLNLSWLMCDKLILYKFKVSEELVRDQNEGTGAVSLGISVASGFIIYGSVSGIGGNIWSAITFWAIGQVLLIIAALVYNLITPYDIHHEIEKDNVAAGVAFSGALISVGIILGLAAEGDFESWNNDLAEYVGYALVGLIILPIVRFLTDLVLIPGVTLTDEIARQDKPNVGAAFIEGFSYIAAAFIIYWCV
jgi:uncharacterized membrane protein YjfL (UPF0719 family)